MSLLLMRKLTFIPMIALVCSGAFAQGTIQYSNNSNARVSIFGRPATPSDGLDIELFYQANNGGAAPAAINESGSLGNWTGTSITQIIAIGGGGIFNGPNLTLSS